MKRKQVKLLIEKIQWIMYKANYVKRKNNKMKLQRNTWTIPVCFSNLTELLFTDFFRLSMFHH